MRNEQHTDDASAAPVHPRAARPGTRTARTARAARTLEGVHAAAGFVGRVSELDLPRVRAVIASWHEAVARDPDGWFAAEAAVADAVAGSGRRAEQRVLLMEMADAFCHAVWYRRAARAAAAERFVHATEPSGQYVATLAMLALLVRDLLDPGDFATVYAPFAAVIPAGDLGSL